MLAAKRSPTPRQAGTWLVLLCLCLSATFVASKPHFYELITTFQSPIDVTRGPSRVVYQKFAFSDPDVVGMAVPNSFSLTSGAMFEEGNSFQISFFTFKRIGLEWVFEYLGTKPLNFPVSDEFALHAAIPNTNYHYVLSKSGIAARVDLSSVSSISEPVYTSLSKDCSYSVLNSQQTGFIVGTMPVMVSAANPSIVNSGFGGPEEAVMRLVLMPDTQKVLMFGFGPSGGQLLQLNENNLAETVTTTLTLPNKPGGLLYLEKFKLVLAYGVYSDVNNCVESLFFNSINFARVHVHKERGFWEISLYRTALFFEEGRYIHLNEENSNAFRATEYTYDSSAAPPVAVRNVVKQSIKFSYYPGTLVKLFGNTQYILKDQAFGSTFMLYRRKQCHADCASCQGDTSSECTSCSDENKYLFIGNGQSTTPGKCGDCSTPGTYKTQDSLSQKICKSCFKACSTCEDITGVCKSCNNTGGYFQFGDAESGTGTVTCDECRGTPQTLVGKRCYIAQQFVTVSGVQNPYKLDTIDVSAVVQITSKDSPKSRKEFMRLLTVALRESLVVTYTNLNGNIKEAVVAKTVVNTAGDYMTIDINFLEPLQANSYRVRFSADRSRGFIDETIVYGLKVFEFDLDYTNRKESAAELAKFSSQGRIISGMMMGVPIKNQAATDTVSLLVSMDPTGLITRLSQMLKLMSKLYLLNINFGDRLTAFLESIEEYFPLLKEPNQELLVYHSLGSKGKLTRKNGLGDIFAKFNWKLIVYYLTWIMMGWRYWVLAAHKPEITNQPAASAEPPKKSMKRSTYILLYLTPKIHLIIFNMVFMDFVFYGVRAGFQVWSWYSTPMALVSVALFAMDMLYLNQLCKYETYWRFFAIWKSIKDPVQFLPADEKEAQNRSDNDSFFDASMIGDKTSSFVKNNFSFHSTGKTGNKSSTVSGGQGQGAKVSKQPNVEREIDTDKTLRNIEANIDILEMLTSPIMLTRSVCGSRACRTLMFMHYVRMSFFLMVLAGGQNVTILSCLMLIGIELGRVCFIASIVLAKQKQRVRVFKNTILMFWEMSQSVFLAGFLILCLIMSGYKFDELVPSSMQLGGMILILLSVLCEYILFASHLIFQIFEYFRRRKLLKQLKSPPTPVPFTWFIVEKLTPEERKQQMQQDLDSSGFDDIEDEPTGNANNQRGRLLFNRKFQQPKQLENLDLGEEKKLGVNLISKKPQGSLLRPVEEFSVGKPLRKTMHGAHISEIVPARKISENLELPLPLMTKHKSSGGTGSGSSDEKIDMNRRDYGLSRNDQITGDVSGPVFGQTEEEPIADSRMNTRLTNRTDAVKPPPLRIPRKASETMGEANRKKSLGRSPLLNKSPGMPLKFTSNAAKKDLVKQGLTSKLSQGRSEKSGDS